LKEKEAQFKTERKLVMYVEKDNGSYSPIETGSYMIQNYFDDFLEKREHLKENFSEKLKKGEISPIEYYRVLINIGISDLATRVGISKRKLNKHLNPKDFSKISLNQLQRYAEVFRVPIANLFQLFSQPPDEWKIKQSNTLNPFIVTTELKESKSE